MTLLASPGCALAASIPSGNPHPDSELYSGWLKMYDLKFDDAHRGFAAWKQSHPADALGPISDTFGLRADNAALVEKQSLTALSLTKEGRTYSERLLQESPQSFDAWLGPGIENYLLSLKPAPLRLLLRMTGSNIDREKGMEELRQTADHGYYLEPFAKLLLAVAALRDKNPSGAKDILAELHRRFPDNELYTRELNRVAQSTH